MSSEGEPTNNHLWIWDGDRIVCTECLLDYEDWKKGIPHDEL